jgi:orotate phosphoribosyltransferase-like protein
MPQQYPVEFRQRVLALLEAGAKVADVATELDVSTNTISETKKRSVRLEVRRTRLSEPAQRRLWPDWRHHAFITSDHNISMASADASHREHAVIELAIRDLKRGAGRNHIP